MPHEREHEGIRMGILHVWEEGISQTPLPDKWPIARPQLATLEERLQRPELRQAFTWYIQRRAGLHGVQVLPGCTWCGLPTGMFCDFCKVQPARAVCSDCCGQRGLAGDVCRSCMDDLNEYEYDFCHDFEYDEPLPL